MWRLRGRARMVMQHVGPGRVRRRLQLPRRGSRAYRCAHGLPCCSLKVNCLMLRQRQNVKRQQLEADRNEHVLPCVCFDLTLWLLYRA